jgi:hypothetical protein
MKFFATAALTAAVFVAGVSIAQAEMLKMKATLNGAQEVPAVTTRGTGMANFTFDTVTRKLDYDISYSGLTGPAAAAHIHGPAAAGANAGVMVPFPAAASPIKGSATLTEAQATALMAGNTYVNVHTAAHGGGEIRGQITR